MAIIKKIVNLLSIICYIAIGIYALVSLPILLGYKPLVVLSGSMEPTYKVGSVIYYHKVDFGELHVDDVITFKESNKSITHRINRIENGKFITKGDANDSVDPNLVEYNQVDGKVINIYLPYLGYYIKEVNKNIYPTIIIIVVLVLEFILSNFIKEKKDEKE